MAASARVRPRLRISSACSPPGKDGALLRFSLGNEYLKAGDATRAVEHLQRAVALDPDYTAAWKLSARRSRQAGRDAEALAAYRDGIEVARAQGRQAGGKGNDRCSRGGSRSRVTGRASAPASACGPRLRLAKRVGALVAGSLAVPAHPVPAHRVPRGERVELAPQLRVLHRLAVRGLPAVALPAVDPALDAVLDVLRIGEEVDVAVRASATSSARMTAVSSIRLLVVAGSPPKSSFTRSPAIEQRAPAAGPGIALAGAVGVDR